MQWVAFDHMHDEAQYGTVFYESSIVDDTYCRGIKCSENVLPFYCSTYQPKNQKPCKMYGIQNVMCLNCSLLFMQVSDPQHTQ